MCRIHYWDCLTYDPVRHPCPRQCARLWLLTVLEWCQVDRRLDTPEHTSSCEFPTNLQWPWLPWNVACECKVQSFSWELNSALTLPGPSKLRAVLFGKWELHFPISSLSARVGFPAPFKDLLQWFQMSHISSPQTRNKTFPAPETQIHLEWLRVNMPVDSHRNWVS